MTQGGDVKVATAERPGPRRPTRSWLVTLIGLLLLLQAVVLLGLGAYNFWRAGAAPGEMSIGQLQDFVGFTLAILAPLTLIAAIAFLALRRSAWLLAILSQGLGLLLSLVLYLREEPLYVYAVMAYHVVMVLYLNSYDVRTAFRSRPLHPPGELDELGTAT